MSTEIDPNKVLRSFFGADGRLRQMPTKHAKLLVVLERLAQEFAPGQRYTEKAVNETLLRFHEDFCTLRRHLVDYKLLARASGEYWRLEPAAAQ
ncbi:MAG TPA: DUF2087 domain-containing protein [Symbiobacteriaceae bacterium]|jgi:hypothetical protein|nr:DUF2087 domain-containing protein [Symbiobacteriaceae bacterium]